MRSGGWRLIFRAVIGHVVLLRLREWWQDRTDDLVAQRLSEFYLALTLLDVAARSGGDGHEIERHLLDLARECVRRLVIRADRRARIHADVERFVGREAAGNGL